MDPLLYFFSFFHPFVSEGHIGWVDQLEERGGGGGGKKLLRVSCERRKHEQKITRRRLTTMYLQHNK